MRNMDLHCVEDWHGTVPKGVTENKDFKVQEDCTVQRDNNLSIAYTNCPDIVIVHKNTTQ